MKNFIKGLLLACLVSTWNLTLAADSVPPVIDQPGTQPEDGINLESPNKCDNCHGGYNSAVEPAHNWRGSMMAHAGRDPIFWATVAIAEQDFDGAGDLCIRCHSTTGWLAGRSTPTDGSGLAASDSDGVDCDYCHKLTNPDDSEHIGVMNQNFIANEPDPTDPFDWDEVNGIEGYYGSGISSMWGGSDKLGPYDDAEARHQFMQSKYHRDRDFCGTCHDVSNPAVGHLAPNHGTQATANDVVTTGGNLGNPANDNVAFNNPPYAYGIVERTFSEYKSGMISQTLVNDYDDFPEDLKGGALEAVYNAATQNGTIDGNYKNPTMPRYFSCQTCHMRPVKGTGANKKGVPVRDDQPLHDLTGGNYWMPEVIEYLDKQGKILLGGGMSADLTKAMHDGGLRAREQLNLAASLTAHTEGNNVEVKVVNHTGHKLISGYPEGRRMWINIKWYDSIDPDPIHEDGAYGTLDVVIDGTPTKVKTILDLDGANTKIYEAHMGMTTKWAQQLIGLGSPDDLALSYDRISGNVSFTLGQLAGSSPGITHETFHFVLNNTMVADNRIPPYGMKYESARVRNALPVPADQYGNPGSEGSYDYYDEVMLTPPTGAVSATIELLYQPTSWEYIQFLYLANNTAEGKFLAEEGRNILDAWLNTGMAEPHVMASTTWGASTVDCDAPTPTLSSATPGDSQVVVNWSDVSTTEHSVNGYRLYYDQAGKAQLITDLTWAAGDVSYTDTDLTNGQEQCYKATSYIVGEGEEPSCESGFSNTLCATPSNLGQQVPVPDVTGKLQSTAEADILAANLLVGTVGVAYIDTVAEGYIISQQPDGGVQLPKGSEVDLIVSLGPDPSLVCSNILDKGSCNNELICEWQGSPKNGQCAEKPQQANCLLLSDNTSCNAEATCQWDNKNKTCVNN